MQTQKSKRQIKRDEEKRNREKKKKTGAKPLKKATQKQQRLQEAMRNYRLVTVAALTEGGMKRVQKNIDKGTLNLQGKVAEQKNKVFKWADRVVTDKNNALGVHSFASAYNLAIRCDQEIDNFFNRTGLSDNRGTLGEMGVIWIAISYLCDEARFIAGNGYKSQQYNMNTLASTVNTWTSILLDEVDEEKEEKASVLAERWRDIIMGGYA